MKASYNGTLIIQFIYAHIPLQWLKIHQDPHFFLSEYPVSLTNMSGYGSKMVCECRFMLPVMFQTFQIILTTPVT